MSFTFKPDLGEVRWVDSAALTEHLPPFKPPPEFTWCYSLTQGNELVIAVVKPPNAFHRWMQRTLLGVHWRRIK